MVQCTTKDSTKQKLQPTQKQMLFWINSVVNNNDLLF